MFEGEFEPWVEWPEMPSGDWIAPGRPDRPDVLRVRPSEEIEYEEHSQRIIAQLDGDDRGGRRGGGRGIVGGDFLNLPPETPSTDVCAFYRSFRFGQSWGIYIMEDCWERIARFLHACGADSKLAIREAFMMLFRHEYFHFEVDKAVLALERVVEASTGTWRDHYVAHLQTLNPDPLEEALANAHAYTSAPTAIRKLIGEWMDRQPAGYRDFRFVTHARRRPARTQLLTSIMSIHTQPTPYIPDLEKLIDPPVLRSSSESPFSETFQRKFQSKFQGRRLPIYLV